MKIYLGRLHKIRAFPASVANLEVSGWRDWENNREGAGPAVRRPCSGEAPPPPPRAPSSPSVPPGQILGTPPHPSGHLAPGSASDTQVAPG